MAGPKLSPRFRFGMRLNVFARRWRQTLDDHLKDMGFSDATWGPLFHLARQGDGIAQKELAERMHIDTSTLVRLLDILEQDGRIERVTDTADRRTKRLFLTERGRAAVEALQVRLTALETEMLGDVDDAEIDIMLAAFERIDARLQAMQKGR